MRALVQRVREASVGVDGRIVGAIGTGLLVLAAMAADDADADRDWLARQSARPVATGVFGAVMQVALVNDGPVTIWLDSRRRE